MARTTRSKQESSSPQTIYSVHPAVHMQMAWIAGLRDKTGRDLEEWLAFIVKEGPDTEDERREWLKSSFKLGTNYAIWLAERSVGKVNWEDTPESYLAIAPKYVDAMFAGKESLRPIYERLLTLGKELGNDVKFCPCKTIVPFYRKRVFAQVKPATKTRIDLGFALADTKATGRLIDTGGFKKKDRITHRIPISNIDEIDDEVKHWLRMAYERDSVG